MVKKILTYTISTITVILFVLTLIIILIGIKANKNNSIAKLFGYSYSVVATNSMEPTIDVGDVIIGKSIPYAWVEEGDIVVFFSETKGVYIVHRVYDILENGNLVTKGDNPSASIDEEQVTPEKYVGVVISHGKFLNFGNFLLEYRFIVYVLIFLIFGTIIVTETISIVKHLNQHKKEELENRLEQVKSQEKEKIKNQLLEEIKNDNSKAL